MFCWFNKCLHIHSHPPWGNFTCIFAIQKKISIFHLCTHPVCPQHNNKRRNIYYYMNEIFKIKEIKRKTKKLLKFVCTKKWDIKIWIIIINKWQKYRKTWLLYKNSVVSIWFYVAVILFRFSYRQSFSYISNSFSLYMMIILYSIYYHEDPNPPSPTMGTVFLKSIVTKSK